MNPDSRELRRLNEGEDLPEGFFLVPDKHEKQAEELLRGYAESIIVPKNHPLTKWAAQQKATEKRRKQSKQAKKSRAKNRGK